MAGTCVLVLLLMMMMMMITAMEFDDEELKLFDYTGPVHPSELNSTYELYEYLMTRDSVYAGVPPMVHYYNEPQVVKTELYFINIAHIDEIKMQYAATVFLKEAWFDPRFRFERYNRNETVLVSHHSEQHRLWRPDTYFITEREALRHSNTEENTAIFLFSNGTVQCIQKLTMMLECQVKLHRFPLDTQECAIKSSSYSLSNKYLQYKWDDVPESPSSPPVRVGDDVHLSEFEIVDIAHTEYTVYRYTGNYSGLCTILSLQRHMSYYWLQVYIPSGVVVALSWVSFYIDKNAAQARISLGLLTILTTTTQIYGINSGLPRVAYVKAIDVWMLMCLLMVIAAMAEFLVVHYLGRDIRAGIQSRIIHPGQRQMPANKESKQDNLSSVKKYWSARWNLVQRNPATFVDVFSRFAFPCCFFFFNLMYWIYYLLIFHSNPD